MDLSLLLDLDGESETANHLRHRLRWQRLWAACQNGSDSFCLLALRRPGSSLISPGPSPSVYQSEEMLLKIIQALTNVRDTRLQSGLRAFA
jgi:hypothetical protein